MSMITSTILWKRPIKLLYTVCLKRLLALLCFLTHSALNWLSDYSCVAACHSRTVNHFFFATMAIRLVTNNIPPKCALVPQIINFRVRNWANVILLDRWTMHWIILGHYEIYYFNVVDFSLFDLSAQLTIWSCIKCLYSIS